MTQPQIEMKACPNPECGSDSPSVQTYDDVNKPDQYYCACDQCGLSGPMEFTVKDATAKWNALPRSSPQIAPGLRDAIRDALMDDLAKHYEPIVSPMGTVNKGLSTESIDRIATIAADIATLRGGTVDREGFGEWLHKLRTDYLNHGQYRENDVVNYIQVEFAKRLATVMPVDMLLFCPNCGKQHLDHVKPEQQWDNPPHKSHKCDYCQHVWRPADVPTNGVTMIQTQGKADGSAVPAAPVSGVEAVKSAWESLQSRLGELYVKTDISLVPMQNEITAMESALEALGSPEPGSDTLRWTKELPDDRDKLYWCRDAKGHCFGLLTNWDNGYLKYVITHHYHGLRTGRVIELSGKGIEFARIPEPAQPVDAGEAKERGKGAWQMKATIVCGHMCHTGDGLNVWIDECPICGCRNEKYIEGAQCCFSCFQYPCVCGENNHVNPSDFGNIWEFFGLREKQQ